jgi:sortase A
MARRTRILKTLAGLLGAGGVLALGWVVVTWQWREPATSLYALYAQHELAAELADAGFEPRDSVSATARAFRRSVQPGDPIGRIRVPAVGLDAVLVEGTGEASLRTGPGRDRRSGMPGEGRLVYVAGHRTTYGAPFASIDALEPGDEIVLELPYGRFTYRVSGHRVVDDGDLSVLRSPGGELLRLQACHPRFFATARYVVTAELAAVDAGDAPAT